MEASAALHAMQVETNCSVCHGDLKDAVTTECGHNFCFLCLQLCWKDQEDEFLCPLCCHPCLERKFTPNRLLRRVVSVIQNSSREEGQQKVHFCERHNQELSLFCEEDLEVLCSQCTQSPEHQGHQFKCVKEAASYHRQQLWDFAETLKEDLAKIQKLKQQQDESVEDMKVLLSSSKKSLVFAFEYLNGLVEQEEKAALSRLGAEKRRILNTLNTDITALKNHISTLMALIQEVATQSMTSQVNVLRKAGSINPLYEIPQFPALSFFKLREEGCTLPPLYSTLKTIVKTFKERVTLNPKTAHPDLRISDDKSAVCYVKRKHKVCRKSRKFPFDLEVLGSEKFKQDRHYWEVEVENKNTWAVGVCMLQLSSGKKRSWATRLHQKRCWAIRLYRKKYAAVGADAVPVPLCLEEKPRKIGVYLDCDLGQLSFYNMNTESHIHSFQVKMSMPLTPYFCVGRDYPCISICKDSTK